MELRSTSNLWFRYLLTTLSPKWTIRLLFWLCHHRRLPLKKPKTLDEKIQWMKLHYYKNNALVKQCANKLLVRDYVKSCGLEYILNDIIDTYHTVEEINWEKLPQKFVLKWNFGNGGNVVCLNKETIDKEKSLRELKAFHAIQFHLLASEPQYHLANTEKILLCEKFIDTEDGCPPTDYKFYCFHGKAEYVLCCYGRNEHNKPSFYFFNRDWQLQRLNKQGLNAPEGFTIPKPEGMDQLFDIAEQLSKPFPFVRADFYLEKGKPYFGELTFTPSGGFDYGRLPETDLLFGSKISLPEK